MNADEKTAYTFLSNAGFNEVEFEPMGNVPPDFLLDNRIAVEVRRLNQNQLKGDRIVSLEKHRIPLKKMVEKVCSEFVLPATKRSRYYVTFSCYRPFRPSRKLENALRKALSSISENPPSSMISVKIAKGVYIEVIPGSQEIDNETKLFVPGGHCDFDEGGFTTSVFQENIQHCINEKTTKIRKYADLYEEWWLLFVSTISIPHSEELNDVIDNLAINDCWSKVIVLDSFNSHSVVEIM